MFSLWSLPGIGLGCAIINKKRKAVKQTSPYCTIFNDAILLNDHLTDDLSFPKAILLDDMTQYPDAPLLEIHFKRASGADGVYRIPLPDDEKDTLKEAHYVVQMFDGLQGN